MRPPNCRKLRRLLLGIIFGTASGLVVILTTMIASTIQTLFKRDRVTRMASVELWVVLTTLMLVFRFFLDFFGPWYASFFLTRTVQTVEMLNYAMVHYTMGQMQLSAPKVNDYFQVWAVLLITLQYSVKIGRPYSRSKQIPLLDLMSSFWAANLIRMQTFVYLQIPLWLIWSVNAARIICYFSSSDKAEAVNQESMRFTADYMSYEHELGGSQLSADAADTNKSFTMEWYKYLVLGEAQVLNDVREDGIPVQQVTEEPAERRRRRRRILRLDPKEYKKLITVDKIWHVDSGMSRLLGGTADQINQQRQVHEASQTQTRWFAGCRADQLKDVCLSFSLYKLLRHRFHDFPVHEAKLQRQAMKLKRLVFEYILHDADRAFRIVGTEVSFLQDLFYSKHAAMFAAGFPATSLVLSLLLVAGTGYISYPVHYIPERMDESDHNKITHGVFITRVIIVLIIGKELAEICMYVFSQWTVVLMLCSYVKYPCLRNTPVETVIRMMLCLMTWRGRWNHKIHQHNLLISTRPVKFGCITMPWLRRAPKEIKIQECTKKAIFESLKMLEKKNPERLGSYFLNAFGRGALDLNHPLHRFMLDEFPDPHRVLVWHIATCLCEVDLAYNKDPELRLSSNLGLGPFVKKPEAGADLIWWEHYTTAVSLSNYCAYLLTQALLPGNGLVASKVIDEVSREIKYISRWDLSLLYVFNGLRGKFLKLDEAEKQEKSQEDDVEAPAATPPAPDEKKSQHKKQDRDHLQLRKSLTRKGVELGNELMDTFGKEADKAILWEKLAVFWTGFLLHLAETTRASKHRTRLAGRRELTTHLWALLSHAGFMGSANHGHELLDPEDLEYINPLS